jgi:hypothetical protein
MANENQSIGVPYHDEYSKRYYMRQYYPCVTDLKGLEIIDPHAHATFIRGMGESEYIQIEEEGGMEKLRFALTPRKGWDVNFGSPLGYNPITHRWSFYEYCEEDGYDIFGPTGIGTPNDPIILWKFPEVGNAQANP